MKSFCIGSAILVLSCAGVGCSRLHPKTMPPPQAQAPVAPAQSAPPTPSPALAPISPASAPPAPTPQAKPTSPKPKKSHTSVRRASPNKKNSANPLHAPSTSGTPNATSSPIGLLSAGDSAETPALRQQTADLIASTENRLKTINFNLAANKQDAMAQIHLFLTQAKQALAINDLQGANTLAIKAKILVDELLK